MATTGNPPESQANPVRPLVMHRNKRQYCLPSDR